MSVHTGPRPGLLSRATRAGAAKTSAVHGPGDFALVLGAFGLLVLWQAPPWLAVTLAAGGEAWLR